MIDTLAHYARVGWKSGSLTGLMHDAVEDGWWPAALAWPALDAITRRDGERYFDYIARCRKHDFARQVKLIDLRDNLNRGGGPVASLRKRYERAASILSFHVDASPPQTNPVTPT